MIGEIIFVFCAAVRVSLNGISTALDGDDIVMRDDDRVILRNILKDF